MSLDLPQGRIDVSFWVVVGAECEVIDVLGVLPAEPQSELRLDALPLVALQLQLLQLHDHLPPFNRTFGISIRNDSSRPRSNVAPKTGTEAELLQNARYLTFAILLSIF